MCSGSATDGAGGRAAGDNAKRQSNKNWDSWLIVVGVVSAAICSIIILMGPNKKQLHLAGRAAIVFRSPSPLDPARIRSSPVALRSPLFAAVECTAQQRANTRAPPSAASDSRRHFASPNFVQRTSRTHPNWIIIKSK